MSRIWELFIGFTRATLLGYGGGPSTIPLYQIEAVKTFGWVTEEEFGQALAFGNALPGPIATKLSAYIGFKTAGLPGAAVALASVALPTALLMVALFSLLYRFRDHLIIQGLIAGAKPAVFVMLALLAFDYSENAFGGHWGSFLIAAGYFVLVTFAKLHPALSMGAALLAGVALRIVSPTSL